MSQSLTQCKIQVDPTLNSSDRLILGEIIIREIRRRTRSGKSGAGSNFAKYSSSYASLLRRRGAATNVDLDRSGQMLESLTLLEHGQGYITVGISAMNKAAFAKAKYTQGDGRGPTRRWLVISKTFVASQQKALLQAGADTADKNLNTVSDLDIDDPSGLFREGQPLSIEEREALGFQGGRGGTPLDISAGADRRTIRRLLGESPDRAGITRRDEILLVKNRLEITGITGVDRRALRREERRIDRRDRLSDLGALEIEALRFVRESKTLQRQYPQIGGRIAGNEQTFTTVQDRALPQVEALLRPGLIIYDNPIERLSNEQSEDSQRRQRELDSIATYEGYNRVDTLAADPSTRIEQAIPIAERVREEPTVGIDVESVQSGIDSNLGIVRANDFGRDQQSLSQARINQLIQERMRNTLVRRQEIELNRIEQERNRERLDGIRTTGSVVLDEQLAILKRIRRGRN